MVGSEAEHLPALHLQMHCVRCFSWLILCTVVFNTVFNFSPGLGEVTSLPHVCFPQLLVHPFFILSYLFVPPGESLMKPCGAYRPPSPSKEVP